MSVSELLGHRTQENRFLYTDRLFKKVDDGSPVIPSSQSQNRMHSNPYVTPTFLILWPIMRKARLGPRLLLLFRIKPRACSEDGCPGPGPAPLRMPGSRVIHLLPPSIRPRFRIKIRGHTRVFKSSSRYQSSHSSSPYSLSSSRLGPHKLVAS